MHDVLRFWLDRGVDGFRIDVVHKLAKDPALGDEVPGEPPHREDWPTIDDRLRGIRRVVDEYPDRMLVGEVYLFDLRRVVSYVQGGDKLDLAHNFVFVKLPWSAPAFRTAIDEFDALADAASWPAWFLANHDNPPRRQPLRHRRPGPGARRAVALMLYALRGTPFVYQGEELGPARRRDPARPRGRRRRPRPRAGAHPVAAAVGGRTRGRVHDRRAVAADRGRRRALVRRAPGRRSPFPLAFVRRLAELRATLPVLQGGAQTTSMPGPTCWPGAATTATPRSWRP